MRTSIRLRVIKLSFSSWVSFSYFIIVIGYVKSIASKLTWTTGHYFEADLDPICTGICDDTCGMGDVVFWTTAKQ